MGVRSVVALAVLVAACSGGAGLDDLDRDPSEAGVSGARQLEGEVVSTVANIGITVREVEDLARRAGLTPEDALRRLEDEVLLLRAAERAGMANPAAADRAGRRRAVQALLRSAVEADAEVAPLTDDELRGERAAHPERYSRGERRRAVQVAARVPPEAPPAVADAARDLAFQLQADAASQSDPATFLRQQARRPFADLPFEVEANELPPLERGARWDPAILAAVFAGEGPGLVAGPVRSQFGVHVLAVTEVEPAWEASDEEARALIAEQQIAVLRNRRLAELLMGLAQQTPPRIDPGAAARLSALDLGGAAP